MLVPADTLKSLEQLATHLAVKAREASSRATLASLRTAAHEYFTPDDVSSAVVGLGIPDDVSQRVVEKVVVYTFLHQFPVDYEPEAVLRARAVEIVDALKTSNKKDEVSARLAAVLEAIDVGLDALGQSGEALYHAGDKAFTQYKTLGDDLAQEWQLAKDAHSFGRFFEKRRAVTELQNRINFANRPSYLAEAHRRREVETAETGERTTPVFNPDMEADLVAELEAAIVVSPSV